MDGKLAEIINYEKFIILQQSEKVAQMGSWEFNILTGKLSWSDGMYNLFGIPIGTAINPNIYLTHSTQNSRIAAGRIINNLKVDVKDFDETLEISVSNQPNKVLDVHATVQYDEGGHIVKVVGVDIDITTQFNLQQEKENLENKQREQEAAQNLKIFWATLDAQETERKRIAESLHNGLGQLLFGLKLNFQQLDLISAQNLNEISTTKKSINLMLREAIDECKRISQELMPITLEQYGLQTALYEVCAVFNKKIDLKYQFLGLEKKMFKPLELAIYRFIYELLSITTDNGQATIAFLKIVVTELKVEISLENNGIGFGFEKEDAGYGLKMIDNKVKLLHGKLELLLGDGKTSVVKISIPQTGALNDHS